MGEVAANSTAHLVQDIEELRALLGVEAWHVFGGSWGSTLALAYAQAHPGRCLSLTLRGIFLLPRVEIEWFLHGLRAFAPQAWESFISFLPESLRANPCEGYWTQLNHVDPQVRHDAAQSWAAYEARSVALRPGSAAQKSGAQTASSVALARLEAHYMRANRFDPDDALLRGVERIRHIPCAIVQGRYDLLCPLVTAWELHAAWPEASFQIIDDAGHSAFEPGIRAALVDIMDSRV